MNKARKIIIGIYVAVCLFVFLAFLAWYFYLNTFLLDAFLWAEYSGDYSRMDFFLIKMLISIVLGWIILAIPPFFIYKHWSDKNGIYGQRKS